MIGRYKFQKFAFAFEPNQWAEDSETLYIFMFLASDRGQNEHLFFQQDVGKSNCDFCSTVATSKELSLQW